MFPSHGIFLQAQIFDSFETLNASDFNLEVGAVAFVLDTSVMYILTEGGWLPAVVRMLVFLYLSTTLFLSHLSSSPSVFSLSLVSLPPLVATNQTFAVVLGHIPYCACIFFKYIF